MKRFATLALLILSLWSCTKSTHELTPGPWLGVIRMDTLTGNLDVPFNFEVARNGEGWTLTIRNADERIVIDEVTVRGDTIHAKLPVYISEIVAVIGDSLKGYYYPKGTNGKYRYGFYALRGETDRFPWYTDEPRYDVTGRWWFIENPGSPDSLAMVAELKQVGSKVTGTILSPYGDYRYLEGKVSGNKFYFSKNDGAQTIIIRGTITSPDTMSDGLFSGSPRWTTGWVALRDSTARLPEQEQMVRVKKGSSGFEFAGRDLNGNWVRSTDQRFQNKVLAVLAGGSWCPNCLDEGRYFASLYKKYRSKGFEVVSLLFEGKTFEDSKARMERFAGSIGTEYPFLYVAPRGRAQRDSVLYPIEGKMAYPTSMIIDRKGNIRRVETGFSGPGTGQHFQKYAKETEELIVSLLEEE